MMLVRTFLVIAALLLAPRVAVAEVSCFEIVWRNYDDGTTNKGGGGMYDTNFYRGWVYGKVQEMDDAERRIARTLPSIAGLIGPCRMPDGSLFHMVDGLLLQR